MREQDEYPAKNPEKKDCMATEMMRRQRSNALPRHPEEQSDEGSSIMWSLIKKATPYEKNKD